MRDVRISFSSFTERAFKSLGMGGAHFPQYQSPCTHAVVSVLYSFMAVVGAGVGAGATSRQCCHTCIVITSGTALRGGETQYV